MSIVQTNFDLIGEQDLINLVATGVPEGVVIEYKQQLYSGRDEDIKEFLKDVSSFANTLGGHLLIGFSEVDGVPTGVTPITSVDPDTVLQRLESLVRDGIDPRISGTRMKAVPIAAGGFVVVIRVPRSWNPPHRISARSTNRFYARNSSGAHEVSVEELRVLFNQSASAIDRVKALRMERMGRIEAGETASPLVRRDGLLVMHLVPISAFSGTLTVDLQQAHAIAGKLRPIASMGYTPQYNADGFVTARGGDGFGYTQLFRNGAIEATKVNILMTREGRRLIPSLDFDRHIIDVLPNYFDAMNILGVAPPIVLMLTLEGVAGAYLGVNSSHFVFDNPAPISYRMLALPEVVVSDFGDGPSYVRALRPAFDALWNAGGFPASQHFDKTGNWVGAK